MCSDAQAQFAGTRDQDETIDMRQLAALYLGVVLLNLALDLVLGDTLSSYLDWLGRPGQVAATLAALALVIAFKMNTNGGPALVCRLIAGGHIAYGVAYAGLYEGTWLGYGEVVWQFLAALIFLAAGPLVKMKVPKQHRS